MSEFEEKQQEIVNQFKDKLEKIAKETIGAFYTDITPYAEQDAHINFSNAIRDEVIRNLKEEIKGKYSHYSHAHDLRMLLLKNHKEELSNKIIEDLQDKIETLEDRLKQICERYRTY